MLSIILIFGVSEMLGNSVANISPHMKRNLGIRIKSLCSNHSISKLVSIRRRLTFEASNRIRRQAKSQDNAKLSEQLCNLIWWHLKIHMRRLAPATG